MILCTTHLKLKDDAIIYRVDTEEAKVLGLEVPAGTEHFVNKQAAEKAADRFLPLIKGKVTPVRADSFCPLTQR